MPDIALGSAAAVGGCWAGIALAGIAAVFAAAIELLDEVAGVAVLVLAAGAAAAAPAAAPLIGAVADAGGVADVVA